MIKELHRADNSRIDDGGSRARMFRPGASIGKPGKNEFQRHGGDLLELLWVGKAGSFGGEIKSMLRQIWTLGSRD
jgi:hypothetical protein